jgi:hypothetical protein
MTFIHFSDKWFGIIFWKEPWGDIVRCGDNMELWILACKERRGRRERYRQRERETSYQIEKNRIRGAGHTDGEEAFAFTTKADALINDWNSRIPRSGWITQVVRARQYCGFERDDGVSAANALLGTNRMRKYLPLKAIPTLGYFFRNSRNESFDHFVG